MPAALFGVLAVLCGVRFLETGSIPSALAAGAALGFLCIIRPFSAVLIAIPCAVELLRRASSLHYTRLAWFVVGSLPFVTGFLFYNNAVTASPLLDPILGLPQISCRSAAGRRVGYPRHSPGWAIILLMELAQWTSPLLCLLYAMAALWKLGCRRLAFYDFVFPLFVLGYLLVPGTGVTDTAAALSSCSSVCSS
jgi:hypothetical protein